MRWIVEVTSIGKIDKQAYCVDSESWQRALQAARALRDDHASLTGFSIELLDEGFSAVDPMTRLRYFIRRAPDDAPLTPAKSTPHVDSPAATSNVVVPVPDPVATASSRPPSQTTKTAPRPSAPASPKKLNYGKTALFASTGAALLTDDKKSDAVAASAPAPALASETEASSPETKAPASVRPEPPRPTPSVRSLHPPSGAPSAASNPLPSVTPSVTPSAAAAAPHLAEVRPAAVPRPVAVSAPAAASAPQEPPPDEPAPNEPPPQGSIVDPLIPAPALAGIEVLFKREQDPDVRSPLSYREYMYFSLGASDETIARAMLVAQFDLVKTSLEHARPGKLINLAMFDVAFAGKPPVLPVVTLSWKDWKGEPVIEFPRRATSTTSAAVDPVPPSSPPFFFASPISSVEPAPAAASTASRPVSVASAEPPVLEAVAAVAPVAVAPAAVAPTAVAPAAVARAPSPPPSPFGAARRTGSKPNIRLRGDELIADLFEAMHDLHFLRDSIEGADFCLTLALEKIPSRVGIVHLYDIDRREFVVAAARGSNREMSLLRRYPESDPILTAAMRKQRAIVFSDTAAANNLERYRTFGGARSLMVAPVVLGGRFLGALELMDPLDGFAFSENEGYALTYIAEQFAEFVATRGVNVDPERIAASARAP